MDTENKRHLYKLNELEDYKVADNDPDVRGWPLVDNNNEKIGTVNELIVDPDKKKVRYLDVITISDLSKEGGERHLIIPIGTAVLDQNEDKVIVRGIDKDALMAFPEYSGGSITRDYEYDVVEKLRGERPVNPDSLYGHEHYNEDVFYNPRRDLPVVSSERQTSAYKATGRK